MHEKKFQFGVCHTSIAIKLFRMARLLFMCSEHFILCDFKSTKVYFKCNTNKIQSALALNAETEFIGLFLNCLNPDITNLSGNNRWK